MPRINLAVIGGGSKTWMKSLLGDLYLVDDLPGGRITLVDPNLDSARLVAQMLQAFNSQYGKEYDIQVTDDRRAAFDGVDAVIVSFSPGSLEAFRNDLDIPARYGVVMPVSMTVGASGISASLRTAPAAAELIDDLEQIAPGTWVLNVTNPMTVVTAALCRAAKTCRVVGFCHEFHRIGSLLEQLLDIRKPEGMVHADYAYDWLARQGFEYTVAGINHFVWLTRAVWNGRDMIPAIRQACRKASGMEVAGDEVDYATESFKDRAQAKMLLCATFGYLPVVGDRHLVEFLPGLCNIHNGFGLQLGVGKTTIEARELIAIRNSDEMRRIIDDPTSANLTRSGEELADVLRGIVLNEPTTAIVNRPNTGQIENLPDGAIVETLATLDGESITPTPSGQLPGSVASLCRLHSDVHELTYRAAMDGDRETLIEALALDPLSGNANLIDLPAMANDLLDANKPWLPRFFN